MGWYKQALAAAKWQATLDKPLTIDGKDVVIFRNPQKDMLTLEMSDVDGKNRATLKYQSAAEVAALNAQMDAAAAQFKAEKEKPLPKLVVSLPDGTSEVEQTAGRIEFKLPSGKAKTAIGAWRNELAKDGWADDDALLEALAGSLTLQKPDQPGQRLSISYTDSGFFPAEVRVRATGLDLEQSPQGK